MREMKEEGERKKADIGFKKREGREKESENEREIKEEEVM
jgi:hypothetical protein